MIELIEEFTIFPRHSSKLTLAKKDDKIDEEGAI